MRNFRGIFVKVHLTVSHPTRCSPSNPPDDRLLQRLQLFLRLSDEFNQRSDESTAKHRRSTLSAPQHCLLPSYTAPKNNKPSPTMNKDGNYSFNVDLCEIHLLLISIQAIKLPILLHVVNLCESKQTFGWNYGKSSKNPNFYEKSYISIYVVNF